MAIIQLISRYILDEGVSGHLWIEEAFDEISPL